LKDTFQAFDNDGSAQLGFPEYSEAWKFLGRPGDEAAIKNCFDSVDVDGSGLVEWSEFSFSLMGEKALQFGPLADLETLSMLMGDTAGLFSQMKSTMKEMHMSTTDRAERNAELRGRLTNMQGDMQKNMGDMFGKMMGFMGQDPQDLLTDDQVEKVLAQTFAKFDNDGSGELELPEFKKAWEFLGL
jgi:Ca2+-binding EF-hand superfamily protein